MRIDVSKSIYHEHEDAGQNWNRDELRKLRQMLRRLRFLEAKVRENGGLAASDATGSAAFVELEMEALEFVLVDYGYLAEPKRDKPNTLRQNREVTA